MSSSFLAGYHHFSFLQIVPAHERVKPVRNGKDKITLPEDLPVETIVLDVPADESLLAEIITKKSADNLPLYHIAETLKRERFLLAASCFRNESSVLQLL